MTRALSIRQPWADLILRGYKDVENRNWPVPSTVDLPLRIGVHASKRHEFGDGLDLYLDVVGDQGSALLLFSTTPDRRGALLGYVTVTGCHDFRSCPDVEWEWTSASGRTDTRLCSPWADPEGWHWTLADPVALREPIPMRGALGLWRMPDDMRTA